MPRAAATRLVRRDLIESASTALLARFLAPWSTFLATRNIDPLALGDSPTDATRTRLYNLLARGDPALPSDLRQELTDLDEMATLGGHDQLLAVVAERALAKLPRGLTPVDLALVARLDRQDEYRAARVRVECAGVTRYAEYEPRAVARFIAYRDAARVESAKRALGAWFETRNRTAYCDVFVVESADEVMFEVTHGEPPRAHGLLDDKLARRVERLVVTRRDHLIVRRKTGRLQVHARYGNEKETYRRVVGEAFHNDANHYSPAAHLNLAALATHPARALSPEGVPGLEAVHLRALELALLGGGRIEVKHPECALPLLAKEEARSLFRGADVRRATLSLVLRGRSSPVRVELTSSGGVHFNRSDPAIEALAREFLTRRGLLAARAEEESSAIDSDADAAVSEAG